MEKNIPFKEFDLTGKAIIVTGAGRGLGEEMAKALAKYGANLVICSRTRSQLESVAEDCRGLGAEVLVQEADMTKLPDIEAMVEASVKAYGKIDVLVNNAGINIPQWAEDVTEEAWDKIYAVNVKGLFFCAQAVARRMIRQKHGKIINISSQASSVGLIMRAAYCSSKGAVDQLTRVMAVEWAKHNILVNSIAPTYIETPLTKPMFENQEFKEWALGNILLKRIGKPEDVTGAVIYLASDASNLVTGSVLSVDGGWTAH